MRLSATNVDRRIFAHGLWGDALMPNTLAKFKSATERRSRKRITLVLRVARLDSERGTSFCLLKNISTSGVQVKLFAPLNAGSSVCLRVGDDDSLEGSVAWVRDDTAGIEFTRPLESGTLLRVKQELAVRRRRFSPRVDVGGRATIATGGRIYAAELRNISASGAQIRTRQPIELGCAVILNLPGLPRLRAYVRWTQDFDAGIVFEAPIPIPALAGWLERTRRWSEDTVLGKS